MTFRGTISEEEDFLKNEKIFLIMGKNALITYLCSHSKCFFESTQKKRLWVFLAFIVDEMFTEMSIF